MLRSNVFYEKSLWAQFPKYLISRYIYITARKTEFDAPESRT